ncbi:MAG: methionyl-tRNA formyltransferase [Patescibacteria group bacterium]
MENRDIIDIAFFGTSAFSTEVLDALTSKGYCPSLLITTPDRPAGRGMKLSASPLKEWGKEKGMPVFQPESLNNEETLRRIRDMAPNNKRGWDVFIVASYGKMLPANIVNDPIYKSLNVHPSLLPRLRGPSPIQSAILHEDTTGVTIIRMDEKMDHGPILAQEELTYENWPPDAPTLERDLAKRGGEILAEILPKWKEGEIKEEPQNDKKATYTQMIKKEDAYLDIENESPQMLFRKIKAYKEKPKAYFYHNSSKKDGIRVIITEAELRDGKLNIKKVIPEGRKEMEYQNFLQNHT